MKRTLLNGALALTFALSTSASVMADELSHERTMGNNASLSAGLSAHEGETGYYINLGWQVNKYFAVGFDVNSFLNSQTYNVVTDLGDTDFNTALYGDGDFRPRHNTYGLSATLRYPFAMSDATVMAPYIELGYAKMSTKDVVIEHLDGTFSSGSDSGSGSSGSSDAPDEVYSFEDINALRASAGLQFSFDDTHRLVLGGLAYSSDENWSELGLEDDQVGAVVEYGYFPTERLSYHVSFESVDQFGDPVFNMGLSWIFN